MIALIACLMICQTGLEAGKQVREDRIQYTIGRYNVKRDVAEIMVDHNLSKEETMKLINKEVANILNEMSREKVKNDEDIRTSTLQLVKMFDRFLTGQLNFPDRLKAMEMMHKLKADNKRVQASTGEYSKRTIALTKQLDNRIDRAFAKLNGLDKVETAKKPMETGAKKK